MGLISYFIPVALHLVLFLITTSGRAVEKGFLFFSYATTYTCFSTLFNILDHSISNVVLKVICTVILMSVMQVVLYLALLPSFRKVGNHIIKGWGKFYGVVISFWALIVAQSLFTMMRPMSTEESVVFLLTMLAFCITYIAMFNSMQNIVKLSLEKQKALNAELLQAQVDAQAKEAQLVYQNRHDMRFHYQALMALANAGEADKIIDYLNLQSKSLEATSTGRFCENETINNILNVFYQKALMKNITMEIRAAAKPDISVPSPALVSVIANILENALHGAVESKAPNPSITVSIKHKSGHLVISCENTCISTLRFGEMPEHLQGIGVHSVISTAEKYNGSCRFSAGDGIFSCTVIMDE
jgi:sensor histidine kinase YesM